MESYESLKVAIEHNKIAKSKAPKLYDKMNELNYLLRPASDLAIRLGKLSDAVIFCQKAKDILEEKLNLKD